MISMDAMDYLLSTFLPGFTLAYLTHLIQPLFLFSSKSSINFQHQKPLIEHFSSNSYRYFLQHGSKR